MAKFDRAVERAKKDGRLRCHRRFGCWDCLRAIGLTPPFGKREGFKRLYPETAFNRVLVDGPDAAEFGDLGGIPRAMVRPKAETKKGELAPGADNAHLREAIRNREAI